jgi:hypothetical protein
MDFLEQQTALLQEYLAIGNCPDPPVIWCHLFDFGQDNGGFSAVAASNGTWSLASTVWAASVSNMAGTLHIKRTLPASRKILGISAAIDLRSSSGVRTAELNALNPGNNYLFQNTAMSSVAQTIKGQGQVSDVNEIRVRLLTSAGHLAAAVRSLTIWGEGLDPF